MVVSPVGKEHTNNCQRCTKVHGPPRIYFRMCVNTAFGLLQRIWIIVAVVCVLFFKVGAPRTTHEAWSIECHVHAQTTIYCTIYKNSLKYSFDAVQLLIDKLNM